MSSLSAPLPKELGFRKPLKITNQIILQPLPRKGKNTWHKVSIGTLDIDYLISLLVFETIRIIISDNYILCFLNSKGVIL